jgi:hypothetical protein
MDPDIAHIVLAGITAVGAIVWLIGLQYLIASARAGRTGQQPAPGEADLSGGEPAGWLGGSAEVEGDARTLAPRATTLLAKGNLTTFGVVKILRKTDDSVLFERAEAGVANLPAGQWFRRGELRFTPLGSGRTRIEWAAEPARTGWLLGLGGVFQVLGLVALAVGCWAIGTFVVPSPEPDVRWQTLQMVQAVHFLWPPFLCGALYRRARRAVAAQFEALVNNLPYHDG